MKCFRILLFFFVLISCKTSPPIKEEQKFFSVVAWGNVQEISGVVRTQVTIERVTKTCIKFSLIKDMTPFSQVLIINTVATLHEGKYEFEGIDNWENEYLGYITYSNKQIILHLDYTVLSGQDNSIARLYGSTVVLEPGSIDFQ